MASCYHTQAPNKSPPSIFLYPNPFKERERKRNCWQWWSGWQAWQTFQHRASFVKKRRGESLSTLILSISSGILEIIHVYKRVFIDSLAWRVIRIRCFIPFVIMRNKTQTCVLPFRSQLYCRMWCAADSVGKAESLRLYEIFRNKSYGNGSSPCIVFWNIYLSVVFECQINRAKAEIHFNMIVRTTVTGTCSHLHAALQKFHAWTQESSTTHS